MPTLTLNMTINGLGETISRTIRRTADGGGNCEIAVPAGKAGTLSTRTDNETGTLTLGVSHGITTGQVIDLYWSGGSRYSITVGTVSGTSVPIGADNSGTGDNLPAQGTAIVCSPRVTFDCNMDASELSAAAILSKYAATETAMSYVSFRQSGGSETNGVELYPNTPRIYDLSYGGTGYFGTNPFGSDQIAYGVASNGSSTQASTLQVMWVQDSTP